MKHLLLIIVAVVCIAVVAGCTDNSRLRDEIDRAGRLADPPRQRNSAPRLTVTRHQSSRQGNADAL